MKIIKLIFPVILILILFTSCASIPPEAPELSVELGKRLSTLEEANITLLHRFFEMKKEAVDKFIQDEWMPEFTDNILANTKIKAAWDTIVKENNEQDRAEFIRRVTLKTQEKVNAKRLEFIKPLEDIEDMLEQKIRDEYNQARAMNNSITSFLVSAARVDENRQKYMNLLGISDEKINKVIDKTDDVVNGMVIKTGEVIDKIEKGKVYINELLKLKDILTN